MSSTYCSLTVVEPQPESIAVLSNGSEVRANGIVDSDVTRSADDDVIKGLLSLSSATSKVMLLKRNLGWISFLLTLNTSPPELARLL